MKNKESPEEDKNEINSGKDKSKIEEISQEVKKIPNSKKAEERKLKKLMKRKKRARIIVRNLSFKVRIYLIFYIIILLK